MEVGVSDLLQIFYLLAIRPGFARGFFLKIVKDFRDKKYVIFGTDPTISVHQNYVKPSSLCTEVKERQTDFRFYNRTSLRPGFASGHLCDLSGIKNSLSFSGLQTISVHQNYIKPLLCIDEKEGLTNKQTHYRIYNISKDCKHKVEH